MPTLRASNVEGGAFVALQYADGTEFLLDRQGSDIWARWPDSSTLEDTATYLLGPVLGFVLRLRGVTCLHASAVALDGRAVVLMGPPGAGKSTTAAALCQRGHAVLTDDIVALSDDRIRRVIPGVPQIRLWPDATALLYGADDALPRLTPTWEKRALDLTRRPDEFERRPLPIAAIYLLADTATGDGAALRIDTVRGAEALMALLANTYVGYLLDTRMRAQEFAALGSLVSEVPVRRIAAAAARVPVGDLCAHIVDDCRTLRCTA